MPVFLLHGFRWPRAAIRIHIILQNLDDAAAEWLMAPSTQRTMLSSLKGLYPAVMSSLPHLQFIEQHDERNLSAAAASQPFAFVADRVVDCELSVDVGEVMAGGAGSAEEWGALVELRDQIAPGEKVGWWVVYCGDVVRNFGDSSQGGEGEGGEEDEGEESSRTPKGGLKKWFKGKN
ncbi:MAG: hypothetical protein M1819_005347 [Sarea resinae]|nr:MAG: hypothetical protein M1819_005347 [Sarea resinae]